MTIIVSVAQAGSIPFNTAVTMGKAIDWITKAGKAGTEFVLCPEDVIGT